MLWSCATTPNSGPAKSELFREALRHYIWRRRWAQIRAYGARKAGELALKEKDVPRLIHEYRRENLRTRKAKRVSAKTTLNAPRELVHVAEPRVSHRHSQAIPG